MKITKPFNNDTVVVRHFFNKEDLNKINLFLIGCNESFWTDGDKFLDKHSHKNFFGKSGNVNLMYGAEITKILNTYTDKASEILEEYYSDFYLNHNMYTFTRTFDYGMDSHSDNNGENNVLAGCIFYFNDNFKGGHLVYDKLGFSYIPKAGDFVFHPGTSEYEHHVTPVIDGTRFTCGFSAYKN